MQVPIDILRAIAQSKHDAAQHKYECPICWVDESTSANDDGPANAMAAFTRINDGERNANGGSVRTA